MRLLTCAFLVLFCTATLGNVTTISIESSGEYFTDATVNVDDIDNYRDNFNGNIWQRFEVIRYISELLIFF